MIPIGFWLLRFSSISTQPQNQAIRQTLNDSYWFLTFEHFEHFKPNRNFKKTNQFAKPLMIPIGFWLLRFSSISNSTAIWRRLLVKLACGAFWWRRSMPSGEACEALWRRAKSSGEGPPRRRRRRGRHHQAMTASTDAQQNGWWTSSTTSTGRALQGR